MCPRHVIQAAGQQDMDGEDKQTLPRQPKEGGRKTGLRRHQFAKEIKERFSNIRRNQKLGG